jgi:DNA-binding NtrC family response regulator
VVEGPARGVAWQSTRDRCSIGSHHRNDLVIDDPTVSRFHCEIVIDDDRVVVRDQHSRNGTVLDGVIVIEAVPRMGSLLRLGNTVICFELGMEMNRLPLSDETRFGSLQGVSAAMRATFAMLARAAESDATMLLEGETGTGKSQAALSVHRKSARREGTFVIVDCGAILANLLESELFGHEKGSFTGAVTRREGKFEAANGGTLFLDEVGDMPLETQAKLLRAIQEKEFERVGGNHPIKVDVRLLAATNHDLEDAVRHGRFREDLYYRLRVVEVVIPPLAERRDDIPLLIDHFLKQAAKRFNRPPKPLDGAALRACLTYGWRGNVRELRSAIEQALLLASGPEITAADLLPGGVADAGEGEGAAIALTPAFADGGEPLDLKGRSFREAKEQLIGDFERRFLLDALKRNGGNITRAAEEVGMYRQSFQQKMRELGITPDDAG